MVKALWVVCGGGQLTWLDTALAELCFLEAYRSGSDLQASHLPGACRMAGPHSSRADNGGATEQVQTQKDIPSICLCSIC